MKVLLILLLITGCRLSHQTDQFFKSAPGTYTRHSEHEFGIENDTLVIKVMNKRNQIFTIERRWRYQRILDGKKLSADYKIKKSTGRYLPETSELSVKETGEYYYFNLAQKTIINGSIQYQKL